MPADPQLSHFACMLLLALLSGPFSGLLHSPCLLVLDCPNGFLRRHKPGLASLSWPGTLTELAQLTGQNQQGALFLLRISYSTAYFLNFNLPYSHSWFCLTRPPSLFTSRAQSPFLSPLPDLTTSHHQRRQRRPRRQRHSV